MPVDIPLEIKIEPYQMTEGNITALKIIKSWIAGMEVHEANPVPFTSQSEILETMPIPYSEFGRVSEVLVKHYKAKTTYDELKEQYEVLREECRRTHHEIQGIIRKPSFAEIAEKHRQEMKQSTEEEEGKRQAETLKLKETPEKLIALPTHEEKSEPAIHARPQPPEPETPRQQAERIYERVFLELKGKKVKDEDIMATVLKAGIHPDYLQQVTEETVNLLKEKGAIPSPKGTLKRLLGRGKKKENGKKEGEKKGG